MAAHLARMPTHAKRESLIQAVPEAKRQLVWASFPNAMAAHIARTASLDARRELLESVPEEFAGMDMRARVMVLARWLYRKGRRGG